jgi:hypothetical protein
MAEILNGAPISTGHILADNQALSADGIVADSLHDYMHKGIGEHRTKTMTLDADATTASENIFQLTGTCTIVEIYGFIVDATTLTNLTGASFDLYDSAAAVQITKNDGALSGLAVGTLFTKNAAAGVTMAVGDNANGAVVESATIPAQGFAPFHIVQKTGANTYVRFTYTTTDSPIAAQLEIHARFIPRLYTGVTSTLVAV